MKIKDTFNKFLIVYNYQNKNKIEKILYVLYAKKNGEDISIECITYRGSNLRELKVTVIDLGYYQFQKHCKIAEYSANYEKKFIDIAFGAWP